MPASDQETFELLYGMLKGYYQGLVDGALRVNGFFLIAGGWLLTSSTPSSALQTHLPVRHTAIALLVLAHGLYFFIALRAFLLSRSTERLLGELSYMPSKYYANHCIRPVTVAMWYLSNVLITGGIVSALALQD